MPTTLHNLKQKIERFERYTKNEITEINRLIKKLEAEQTPGQQTTLPLGLKDDTIGMWLQNYNISSLKDFELWVSRVQDNKDITDLYREETGYKYTIRQLTQAVKEHYSIPQVEIKEVQP